MGVIFTDEEFEDLIRPIAQKRRAEFNEGCQCPLHRLSKEEREKLMDRVIDETNKELSDHKEKR